MYKILLHALFKMLSVSNMTKYIKISDKEQTEETRNRLKAIEN